MTKYLTLIFLIILEQFGVSTSENIQPEINYRGNNVEQVSYFQDSRPIAEKINEDPISINAKSYLVIDKESTETLSEKNSSESLPMASLTKIMTAVLVLEESDLEKIITVSDTAIASYGMGIDLRRGENLKVQDLLYASLLNSSNDASVALAEYISGSESSFVELMNKKAQELNLLNTHFDNCTGLDSKTHYSSAQDLAKLSRYALKNDKFQDIVATRNKIITSQEGIKHYLTNSNRLMNSDFDVRGIKTGLTDNAGECLITLVNNKDNQIIVVVLGSKKRFGDSEDLIKWSFNNYSWD